MNLVQSFTVLRGGESCLLQDEAELNEAGDLDVSSDEGGELGINLAGDEAEKAKEAVLLEAGGDVLLVNSKLRSRNSSTRQDCVKTYDNDASDELDADIDISLSNGTVNFDLSELRRR